MELTLEELQVIFDALHRVPFGVPAFRGTFNKVEAELKNRGWRRDLQPLPKRKYARKTEYKVVYVQIKNQ